VSSLASDPTMRSIRRQLRTAIDGRVIIPGDASYDRARSVFYDGIDRPPAVIVRPTDPRDVSQVVLLAREIGLELAVRSGGHSLAGHSTSDGGIVLDLADMNALQIDPEQRTAWVQTGLTGSPVPHIPPLIYGGVVAAVALLGWLATVVPTRVALRAAPAEAIGMRE
jgi:hypothetical protein